MVCLFFLSYVASAAAPFVPGSSFWSWGGVLGIWLGALFIFWNIPLAREVSEKRQNLQASAYMYAYLVVLLIAIVALVLTTFSEETFRKLLQMAQPDALPNLNTLVTFMVLLPSALLAWLTPDVGASDRNSGRKSV